MSDHDDHEPETTGEAPVGDDPGLVAGRYRIRRTLGKGGGGHVWLATDEKLGREVALKVVSGDAETEVLLTRGLREARTTATLAHENVVRVYDAFNHDGSPWIVMEYVPGPSLSALLEDDRRLPVAQVASIGAQVATALAAAHQAGILHRDVKPGNVLLTDESAENAKLTDFGIARAEEDSQLTRTGFVSGTAAYFSPELARGEDATTASDVWALGATLYAAVEGRRPFRDEANAVAQLHRIARDLPDRPQHAGPLGPVLKGMLDPDPQARWDAARAARELADVASGGAAAGAAWAAGAAGAGAGAAAAGSRRPDPATQAVPRADDTRAMPVARGHEPPREHGREPGRPAATTPPPGGTPRRSRRRGVWLGWLLAVPLLVLLGWLVWTIVQGVDTGDAGGADGGTDNGSSTAAQEDPVGTDEAQVLVEDFYQQLEQGDVSSARALMTPDAWLPDDIADGLTSVALAGTQAQEQDDGTAEVATEATYSYGQSTIVQDETLRVSRVDGELQIHYRSAQAAGDSPETSPAEETGPEEETDESGPDQGEDDQGEDDQGEDDQGEDDEETEDP